MICIGTAGWSIPATARAGFPGAGSHLERYAGVLNCAEINSTFYRVHKAETFARWVDSVPESFRFSVKIPREITHEQKLTDVGHLLEMFLLQATCLGEKLHCLLVQLPGSFVFDDGVARAFLREFREQYDGPIAFEPRHPSWFAAAPAQLLSGYHVSRVGADPAVVPAAAIPGGADQISYLRLHGSPRIYYSSYENAALERAAAVLLAAHHRGAQGWCIFDNTASGAAAADALRLQSMIWRQLSESGSHSRF